MYLRKKYYYFFIPLVPLLIILSFLLSPPSSWTDNEPPGWPNKYPENSLQGMLAATNRLAYETWTSPTVHSRAVAYSSAAYWDAYRATSDSNSIIALPVKGTPSSKAGVTAFVKVYTTMIPLPVSEEFALRYDFSDERGIEAANKTLQNASLDNFSSNPATYQDMLKSEEITDLNNRKVWLPVYNSGSILEPSWGSMTPIFPGVLDCKSPPPLYTEESLEIEASELEKEITKSTKSSSYPLLTSLYAAWFPRASIMHSNLGLSVDNVLSNMLDDSNVSEKTKDSVILQYALTMHDLKIVTYRDKYTYKVPPIQAFGKVMTIDVPYFPSYPSEPAAMIGSLEFIVADKSLSAKPRLEIPGNMHSQPWNRVLNSVEEVAEEVNALSYLAGSVYTFDIKQGQALGECVSLVVANSLKSKGI